MNAVEQLIVRKGDNEFTFARGKAGWEVADKGGYPAKAEKMKNENPGKFKALRAAAFYGGK